jgi:uncharacterized protein YggE
MRFTAASLVLALSFVASHCIAEEAQPRTVSAGGEALVYVQPDEVVFQFGVETRDPSLDKAESLNDETAAKLLAAVKKLGIEDADISTAQLNVQVLYQDNRDLPIRGYSVDRAYCVQLKDPQKLRTLVDTVIKNGANQLTGVDFRTTQLRKYRDQARDMAIKAAHEKGEALAAALNCKTGSPRTINETGFYWGYCGNSNVNYATQNAAQAAPFNGDSSTDQSLPLGRIAVRANVNVVFDLQ